VGWIILKRTFSGKYWNATTLPPASIVPFIMNSGYNYAGRSPSTNLVNPANAVGCRAMGLQLLPSPSGFQHKQKQISRHCQLISSKFPISWDLPCDQSDCCLQAGMPLSQDCEKEAAKEVLYTAKSHPAAKMLSPPA
jgi:hypothetical protein